MNLLAGFTAQSFNGALNRFIPQAGLRTRSFITPRLHGERRRLGRARDPLRADGRLVGHVLLGAQRAGHRDGLRLLRGGLGHLHAAGQRAGGLARQPPGCSWRTASSASSSCSCWCCSWRPSRSIWASTCRGWCRPSWPCRSSTCSSSATSCRATPCSPATSSPPATARSGASSPATTRGRSACSPPAASFRSSWPPASTRGRPPTSTWPG